MANKPHTHGRFGITDGDTPTTFAEDSTPFVSNCAVDEELAPNPTPFKGTHEEFLPPAQLNMSSQVSDDRDHPESPIIKSRRSRSRVDISPQATAIADDIEMLGMTSPVSGKFNKLQSVKLRSLVIGRDYEYRNRLGDWFPVKIVSEDIAAGTYVGESLFRKGQMFARIKASRCIESAAPAKTNWVSYVFWVLFDFGATAALVLGLIFGVIDAIKPHWWWGQHVLTYGVMLIVFIARLFWHFVIRSERHVNAVPRFVTQKVEMDGKQVYFVGTMHVSPGSAKDVVKVIDEVDPDVVMIELDYDRLTAMKESEDPKPCDQFVFKKPDGTTVRGIHTDWNANLNKHEIEGTLTFENSEDLTGKILVAPYIKSGHANFVYSAQKRGAMAVFFLDLQSGAPGTGTAEPSETLVGTSGFFSLWKFFCATGRNNPPEIPCYLVPSRHFDLMLDEGVVINFTVYAGNISSPSTCCQSCLRTTCMMGTGVGVMYGLIRMAGCKVGQEFIIADRLAHERGKVLATIDMGVGRLGHQLLQRLIPYPSNLWYMLTAWAAVPRTLFTWIFLPQMHKLDLALNMIWGFARFKLRTWVAFILGAGIASLIMYGIIKLVQVAIISGVEASATAAGSSQQFAKSVSEWVGIGLVLGLIMYAFPVIYKGLLDSRDEQMYRGAVAQIRLRPNASKFVIVIGAAHTNGMIRRMYQRGFMPNGEFDQARKNWAPFPFNTKLGMPFFY
eukprot:GEMP01024020.1.p1 GENE.GEMP01024020.1~~GEMP01024020.1.p1  ORF type:complete len:727 (+),score=124.97 GEMP01024020.1:172-2352(+)